MWNLMNKINWQTKKKQTQRVMIFGSKGVQLCSAHLPASPHNLLGRQQSSLQVGTGKRYFFLPCLTTSPWKCCCLVLPFFGKKENYKGRMNWASFIFLTEMTTDRKLFQVNGCLVGHYNPSAPSSGTTGPCPLYLRDLFRAGQGASSAMVTNMC